MKYNYTTMKYTLSYTAKRIAFSLISAVVLTFVLGISVHTAQAEDFGVGGDDSWLLEYGIGGDSYLGNYGVGGDSRPQEFAVGGDSTNQNFGVGGDYYLQTYAVNDDFMASNFGVGGDSRPQEFAVGGDFSTQDFGVGGDFTTPEFGVGGDFKVSEAPVVTEPYSHSETEWSVSLGTGLAYGYGGSYGGSYGYVGNYGYSAPTYTYTNPIYTYNNPTQSTPSCTLRASDTSIGEDDETTLTWTTTNASTVSLNGGIGTVGSNGSREVSPNTTQTYVLIAIASNGSSVTCTETVDVDEDDDNGSVRCDSFTVSDDEVDDGDRVTLRWRTTGADEVRINNGVGSVDDDGEERVTIDRDTTFTLTAENGNDSDTCRVSVDVDRDDSNDVAPRCRLSISDTSITSGERVTLSWENLRTDRIVIRDTQDNRIADSRNDRNLDEDEDSISVSPTRSTAYTLTAYNGNETRTCTVRVSVDGVSVTTTRTQDTISLSEVPYTGFEAGPLLTIVFYTVLVLWGVIVAFFLLRKHTEAHGVATQSLLPETPAVAAVAPVAYEPVTTISPIHAVPSNLPTDEVEGGDTMKILESYAHEKSALVSSDALRFIASQEGDLDAQRVTLDRVIAGAKARYPKENDWVVINKERVLAILGE
jgi:hypothetical protein